MSKKLDWKKANDIGKPKRSLGDDIEYRKADRAAKWLAKAEKRGVDTVNPNHRTIARGQPS